MVDIDNKSIKTMAGSLNKVLLIGRLGADPEIKQMVNGKSVARLSLATSNTWKDKNKAPVLIVCAHRPKSWPGIR